MDNNNDEESYPPTSFPGVDFSSLNHDHNHPHHQQLMMMSPRINGGDNRNTQMVDSSQHLPSGFCSSTSFDKLSFADVMQFADFGPKLALNQISNTSEEEQQQDEEGRINLDPNVYFLKFPVLNERLQEDQSNMMAPQQMMRNDENNNGRVILEEEKDQARVSESTSVQLQFLGEDTLQKSPVTTEGKNKRKRPRTMKTTEEVESQRMTHIAVERNRRKQMNEHLRVLRGLMPGSYVQRGDQASIIGGAIEFVRELEQLLQCLESQKRRRLYGDNPPRPNTGPDSSTSLPLQQPQPPPFFPLPDDQMKLVEMFDAGLREETAESKSCLADVEVRLLGFDAMIKILCRRKPGQLIKVIEALEDLQLNILHTNITTIEQTVLYSFNVKVASEARFTAEDMANSVQQIFSFIHTNSSTI